MSTIKEIIYRAEDGVLMIIPVDDSQPITPRWLVELNPTFQTNFNLIKGFAETQVENLKYIIYKSIDDILNVEGDSIVQVSSYDETNEVKSAVVQLLIDCELLLQSSN